MILLNKPDQITSIFAHLYNRLYTYRFLWLKAGTATTTLALPKKENNEVNSIIIVKQFIHIHVYGSSCLRGQNFGPLKPSRVGEWFSTCVSLMSYLRTLEQFTMYSQMLPLTVSTSAALYPALLT